MKDDSLVIALVKKKTSGSTQSLACYSALELDDCSKKEGSLPSAACPVLLLLKQCSPDLSLQLSAMLPHLPYPPEKERTAGGRT